MKERRRGDRTVGFFPVKLRIGTDVELNVDLVNHSATGARLMANRVLNLGTAVQMVVGNDVFNGVVQYCRLEARERYSVGLKFGS